MSKYNPCVFCGEDYNVPEPNLVLGIYPDLGKIFSDHMDNCFMYHLWQKSNPALMAYKEHLINNNKVKECLNERKI